MNVVGFLIFWLFLAATSWGKGKPSEPLSLPFDPKAPPATISVEEQQAKQQGERDRAKKRVNEVLGVSPPVQRTPDRNVNDVNQDGSEETGVEQ